MPEIKNTFTQGKMNKDLDERLIPNGQYREAHNIKVSVSDDSDVGTVQNVLGNERLDSIVPASYQCIGSISDEKTNKLYWFVTKNGVRDAIIQYDLNIQDSKIVIVDTNLDTLKFSNKIITGINIIDNLLFFTDGVNEPKKINIDSCIAGTTTTNIDIATHTQLVVDGVNMNIDINESHITVIRKNPKSQVDVIINKPITQTSTKLFEKIFPRFSYRYKYQDGEYSSFAPFTNVVFNPSYREEYSKDDAYSSVESYNTAMVNNIQSVELKNFKTSHTPEDVIQVEILYKQEGTNVVFSIKKINLGTDEWDNNSYIVKSESIYAALPSDQILRVFDAVPTKALAQEITGNRLIYGNYTQGHNLKNYAGNNVSAEFLNADYEVRNIKKSFNDGGIESVKSQRKYQVGFVLGDKYGRETPVFTSEDGFVEIPWYNYEKPSIGLSASETLQITVNSGIGVGSPLSAPPLWAEYYKYYIKETSSEYYNLIMDKAYIPSRLNVFDNEEDHVWISFPSSDRSKVSEEDYLTLKKLVGGNENQISIENKFKILAIDNEAPDQIKFDYLPLGLATQTTAGVTSFLTSNTDGLMRDATYRIDQETDMIYVNREAWVSDCNGGSLTDDGENENMYVNNMYMSFENRVDNVETSEKYKVISILFVNDNYNIKLNRKITQKDAQLADVNSVANDTTSGLKDDIVLKFERKEQKDLDEFSGKFFVKIVASRAAVNNIEYSAQPDLTSQFIVSIKKPIRWYVESADGINDPTTGLINGEYPNIAFSNHARLDTINGGITLTDTEAAWALVMTSNSGYAGSNYDGDQRTFFIDNAYFVAGQINNNNYAKQSGQTWKGTGIQYPPEAAWNVANGWYIPVLPGVFNNGTGFVYDSKPLYYNSDTGQSDEILIDEDINGLEGYVQTTGPSHVPDDQGIAGYRVWLKGKVQDRFNYDYSVYSEQDGKHYLHLSFLGPGVDLHDGSFAGLSTAELVGPNSISNKLQGIWGGGYFSELGFVLHMEGNYDAAGDPQLNAPGPGVGQGYDAGYTTQHERQWDPSYPMSEDPEGTIRDFVNNIKKNSKFKFSNDSNDTIITIVSDPVVKKLYNHTPWRAYKAWDGTGTSPASSNIALGNNSVEEAAVAWVQDVNNPTKLNTLKTRIQNFGKRNNRRVSYIFEINQDISNLLDDNALLDSDGDGTNNLVDIQFLSKDPNILIGKIKDVSAIWETEPKTEEGLDIYYEASSAYPFRVNKNTNELLAPIGSRVEFVTGDRDGSLLSEARNGELTILRDIFVQEWIEDNIVILTSGFNVYNQNGTAIDYNGKQIRFYKDDGSFVTLRSLGVSNPQSNTISVFNIDTTIDSSMVQGLSWSNCFSFGNGIESDRIRDDFNAPQITNGVKASITLEQDYKEEHRKSGLIFSGIYNSTSSVNNLNQFIQAEKITKDLNPTYGSIQKLFQRRISLVAFCEDRVVSITSNKDSLFNADGDPQLISSTNVLGDATPFVGDYGISKNPESFAKESYRAYFTDKQRGAVLRLSMDGLTPISEAGMADYFRDNLRTTDRLIGSFDNHSKYYNLTIGDPQPGLNLIANNTFVTGSNAVQVQNPQLILNSSIIPQTPLTYPIITVANDNFSENSTLQSQANIANYHEIPQYSILPESTTTTTTTTTQFQTQAFAGQFYGFSSSPSSDNPFDEDNFGQDNYVALPTSISTNFPANMDSYQFPTHFPNSPGAQQSSSTNFWSDPSTNGNNFGPSEDVFFQNDTAAYFNSGGQFGQFGSAGPSTPWFNQNTSHAALGIIFDGTNQQGSSDANGVVFPGTRDADGNPNISNLLGNLSVDYPSARDNTIFNGEEIKITFFFRNFVSTNHDVGGSHPAPYGRIMAIYLYDGDPNNGGTQISSSNILDINNLPAGVTSSDYATYNAPTGSTTSYLKGFQDDSVASWPAEFGSSNNLHNVFFKFTDGTENESIVVNDLQVVFKIWQEPTDPGYAFGAMSSMNIRKVYRLEQTVTTTTTTTNNSDGIPSVTIPAFATVIHSTHEWDPPGGGNYYQPQSIATYGSGFAGAAQVTETSQGNSITYTAPPGTTIDPLGYGVANMGSVSNGTVVYNDGTGGVGMYGPYTTPVYPPNSLGGNDPAPISFYGTTLINDEIKTESTGVSVIEQELLTDFQTNDYYVVDLVYTGSVFGNPIDIKLIQPNSNVDFVQMTVDDFYATQTNIYRCFFQSSQTTDQLNIVTNNTEITITDIYVVNVTPGPTGGIALQWTMPANLGTNYFYVPNIYADDTFGFVFTDQATNADAVFQFLNPQTQSTLPVTAGGYELKFDITNYTSGTLALLVGGATDGEIFSNIDNIGHYRILLTLDGIASTNNVERAPLNTSNYTIIGDTSVHGTGGPAVVSFTPDNAFEGSLDNIELIDTTNIFSSGGSIGSFSTNGFNPLLNNYIDYDSVNEVVVFNNAPAGPLPGFNTPVQLVQALPNLPSNNTYLVSFTYANISGEIKCYYYNSDKKGFEIIVPQGSGTYTQNHIIGEATQTDEVLNSLVFAVNSLANGSLDNIVVQQVFPGFEGTTISYSEKVRGWVSFKSFVLEQGASLSNNYYTFKNGGLFKHHSEGQDRVNFYGIPYDSSITAVLNESPSIVKYFNTVSYEGSQAKILDNSLYNYDVGTKGWNVDYIKTDSDKGSVEEFVEKEGKWFNYIRGNQNVVDTSALNFQGLGTVKIVTI